MFKNGKIKKLILISLVLFTVSVNAKEQENSSYISLEIDPAAYTHNGYSLNLKFNPCVFTNFSIMASIFSADYPFYLLDNVIERNGGNNLRLETGFAFFLDFYTSDINKGFHFGPSVVFLNKSVKNVNFDRRLEFKTLYPNLRFGYIWYPLKLYNFYLNPWGSIGPELNLDEGNERLGIYYETNDFLYTVALHIGYRFDLNCYR